MRTSLTRRAAYALAATSLTLAATTTAYAADGQSKDGHFSFAVIGDIPYGAAQIAAFPGWIRSPATP